MRKTLIAIALLTLGCTEASQKVETQKEETVEAAYADTSMRQAPDTYSVAPKQTEDSGAAAAQSGSMAEYANQRFKEVTIEKLGAGKFRISGKGQIFEASFGWVVEDGHKYAQILCPALAHFLNFFAYSANIMSEYGEAKSFFGP